MLMDRLARLGAEFSAQLMEIVREASREELAARKVSTAPAVSAAPAPTSAPKRGPGRPRKNPLPASSPTRTPTRAPAREIDGALVAAAVTYFAGRGNKGATSTQLAAFLDEHGLSAEGDLIAELMKRGAIRDAGFRRSTGTGNKTSPVFVSA